MNPKSSDGDGAAVADMRDVHANGELHHTTQQHLQGLLADSATYQSDVRRRDGWHNDGGTRDAAASEASDGFGGDHASNKEAWLTEAQGNGVEIHLRESYVSLRIL